MRDFLTNILKYSMKNGSSTPVHSAGHPQCRALLVVSRCGGARHPRWVVAPQGNIQPEGKVKQSVTYQTHSRLLTTCSDQHNIDNMTMQTWPTYTG